MMRTTIAETFRRLLGRTPAATRAPAIRNQAYEGASQRGRAQLWRSPTIGANDGVLPALATLRARSRAAVRNDGYARAAIDRLVSNIVGTGIIPQSGAPDQAFRDSVHQVWLRWTDEADADGRLDFYGLQALIVRCWLESGECFVRLRFRRPEDGLTVPLQLQVLEPEFCPEDYNLTTTSTGNRIRAGIEFSPIGKRVAYWFYRQRPGEFQDLNTSELVRVPAVDPIGGRDVVLHIYEPLRAGQIRGIPQLTQALVKLRDLDLYGDATLLRQQISNLFVGFLKREAFGDGTLDPLTGRAIETDEHGKGLIQLEPGIFHELEPGEEVTFADPPEAQGFAEFARAQLMAAAVACDVPYEVLTGDMREVNDRTVRVILHEFRRRVEQRQHHIVAHQLCRPVWATWFGLALLSSLRLPPSANFLEAPGAWETWSRVEWTPPTWPYLHPVQDCEAERAMVRAGFKSRTQVVKERGFDIEQVDRELAADNARADALGLRLDSDPRKTTPQGSATSASTDPAGATGGTPR